MPIRTSGQPGPRSGPPTQPPSPQPGHEAAGFDLLGCHSSRDGHAAVTLRDKRTGAMMSLQRIPFEHRYGEDADSECRRIQAAAREIISAMADGMR